MRASLFALAALASGAFAIAPPNHEANRNLFKIPGGDAQEVTTAKHATFTQLIDHADPSCGTFEQYYMYDTTYWKGPGSPVVLFTPGEVNASAYTSYLTTNRSTGLVAERVGAAIIVLEHRYWGTSTPFTDFTSANLTYLTLENAIADLTYFANNVQLPFAKHTKTNAKDVPWLLIGGSYSGALAAWTESVSPGTFWAYQCTSGPVESISNYYGYFLPVQEGMPKNCSKDVNLVVDHMDNVFNTGTAKEIHDLKAMFGLESVQHASDVMSFLANGLFLWQGNQFYENSGFFDFCDYVENAVNATSVPGAGGVGLEKALQGYARWSKDYYLPDYCQGSYGYDFKGGASTACLDTYNPKNPIFTDRTPSNTADRQWVWMTCNQPFGYWQGGAPQGQSTVVSRLVNPEYLIRQCGLYFPDGFGIASGKTEAQVNAYDGGWSGKRIVNSTRLIYGNGGYDPWREATVSSDLRPEGPLQSTAAVPVNIVPGGFHCSDLVTENGKVNAGCQAVINKEVEQFAKWVDEWPSSYKAERSWSA